jgi:hypothetical protein
LLLCCSTNTVLDIEFLKLVSLSFHTFTTTKKIIQFIELFIFDENSNIIGDYTKSKRILTFLKELLYYSYHLFKNGTLLIKIKRNTTEFIS